MPEIQNEVKITNLGEAVALVTLGFKLLRLEKTGKPRQRWLIFQNGHPDPASEIGYDYPMAEFVLAAYWNRKLELEARTFFETIKELKTKIISSYTPDETQP